MNFSFDNLAISALKQQHYDLYLALVLIPKEHRRPFLTLFSLYAEIHHIYAHTSEDVTTLLRLTWWKEHLGECRQGRIKDHYLSHLLGHCCQQHPDLFASLEHALDSHIDFVHRQGHYATLPELHHFIQQAYVQPVTTYCQHMDSMPSRSITLYQHITLTYHTCHFFFHCALFLKKEWCLFPESSLKKYNIPHKEALWQSPPDDNVLRALFASVLPNIPPIEKDKSPFMRPFLLLHSLQQHYASLMQHSPESLLTVPVPVSRLKKLWKTILL